jgi:hypothetical protein
MPNVSPQVFQMKSSKVSEKEKSRYENFETQVKSERAVRKAVAWYEQALKEVRDNTSAIPTMKNKLGDKLEIQFSELMTIFQDPKVSEQTKGEIRGLFLELSKEMSDSKKLKFVETMSGVKCEVDDKSQKMMDLVIKHAFIDIDMADVAWATGKCQYKTIQ